MAEDTKPNPTPAAPPANAAWTKEQLGLFVKGVVEEAIKPLQAEVTRNFELFVKGSHVKSGQEDLEKGIRVARMVKSLIVSRTDMIPVKEAGIKLYPKDETLHKALGDATGSTGGFIVTPEYSADIIPFLRDMAVVRKAGARTVPMGSNVLSIPRQDSGSSASYVGENANIGKTEPGLGLIQLNAKKLAALVPVSNELIRDSSPSADAFVRDDLVQALATREDLAFIRDDGTANKPKGMRFWVDPANITVANSTESLTNTIADLKTSIKVFKQGRKGRVIRPYWFMSTRTEQYLMHKTTGAPERYFWRDEMLTGKFFGYPYSVTDQIPDNLNPGGNKSELYLVDMWEAIIGENMALELAVSQEAAYDDGGTLKAAFSLDQTVIRAIARHDFAMRYGKALHILDQVPWV